MPSQQRMVDRDRSTLSPEALRDAQRHLQTMAPGSLLQLGVALGDGRYIDAYMGMYRDRLAQLIEDALRDADRRG
jgi:hypothetical protein